MDNGVHDFKLQDLRTLVATTPYRRQMWSRFLAFVGAPVMDGRFSYLFLGGGFVSAMPRPHDIDIILQTRDPYGPEAFHAIEHYFRVGLDAINQVYGIHLHFWMENAPPGFSDYRIFFQYAKPERRHDFTQQGLVRISLSELGIKKQLRQLLGGFEIDDETTVESGGPPPRPISETPSPRPRRARRQREKR